MCFHVMSPLWIREPWGPVGSWQCGLEAIVFLWEISVRLFDRGASPTHVTAGDCLPVRDRGRSPPLQTAS